MLEMSQIVRLKEENKKAEIELLDFEWYYLTSTKYIYAIKSLSASLLKSSYSIRASSWSTSRFQKGIFFSFLDRMVLFLPFFLSSMDFFFFLNEDFLPALIFPEDFPEANSSTCEFCRVRNVNKIWK